MKPPTKQMAIAVFFDVRKITKAEASTRLETLSLKLFEVLKEEFGDLVIPSYPNEPVYIDGKYDDWHDSQGPEDWYCDPGTEICTDCPKKVECLQSGKGCDFKEPTLNQCQECAASRKCFLPRRQWEKR